MKQQATKLTQAQVRYLHHWAALGYEYKAGDVIPEDLAIRPPALEKAGRKEVIASICLLALIILAGSIGYL